MAFSSTPGVNSQIYKDKYTDVEHIVITRKRLLNGKSTSEGWFGDNWVKLRINPSRLSIATSKVISRVQTNTRWVFQHWGIEPYTIQYNGVTGYMLSTTRTMNSIPAGAATPPGQEQENREIASSVNDMPGSPYETEAYLSLARLRQFYLEPHVSLQGLDLTRVRGSDIDRRLKELLLDFYYRDQVYTGYFTRMNIEEQEGSPWMWNYDMEFIAYDAKLGNNGYKATLASEAVKTTQGVNFSYDIDKALIDVWNKTIQRTGTAEELAIEMNASEITV